MITQPPGDRSIVLVSGDIESTVALHIDKKVADLAVFLDDGSPRSVAAQVMAGEQADALGIELEVVDIEALVKSTRGNFQGGIAATIGAAIAVARDVTVVTVGARIGPTHSRAERPHLDGAWIQSLNSAIHVGTGHLVKLKAPLAWRTLPEVIKMAKDLEIDLDRTWSCREGKVCGSCPPCIERDAALAKS